MIYRAFCTRKSLIAFLYVGGLLMFKAQNKLDLAIDNLQNNYTQEKVYLLLDRTNYAVGDQLFFKSFVFDGYMRSNISSTLFVELYDHNKILVDKKTIFLNNGEGNGSFELKENLNEDIYFVRAYTSWMANFSEDYNFIKKIPIYNPNSNQKLVLEKNPKWSAGIFPESGTFVDNIPTKVAVRIFSDDIFPASWSGYVVDESNPNLKLATFKAMDKNVGTFSITPKKGVKYRAVVEDDKGKKQTINLPQVSESGVNLHIDSDDKGLHYKIIGTNLSQGLKNYKIIGTINNVLTYRANIPNTNSEITSNIPTKISNDNNAIVQITVFDENDNIAAQRLSFIKPKNLNIEKPNLEFSLNNKPRSFNSFDIIPDADFPKYTVLVKDANDANPNKENLLSFLWLTSDFTSNINSPAQYFSKDSSSEALDALLISEKWNRFDWKKLLSGDKPEIIYKPQQNLSFRGRVTLNGRALPNKSVNLVFQTSQDSNKGIIQAKTDDNGFIFLNNISIDEPVTVSYYLNSDKNDTPSSENLEITFQPLVDFVPYKKELPKTNYKLIDISLKPEQTASAANALQNKKNNQILKTSEETQIQEVKVTAKKVDLKDKLDKELSTGRFSSNDATIFDLVNEHPEAQASINILQWLQGRVAGVTFNMDGSGNYIPSIRGSQATLYLDEVQVDAGMISNIPVSTIAMVKVLKNGGLINNAIAIYTRRGDMVVKEESKTISNNKTILKAYDRSAEFEQPDITSDNYKKITKDTRELLYWNPNMQEDGGLAPRAKFFNNDNAQNREIIIIGFDKDDRILYYDEVIK